MEPRFFRVRCASSGSESMPLATGPGFGLSGGICCGCGLACQELVGVGRFVIKGDAAAWPDVIPMGEAPFLVSERIAASLHEMCPDTVTPLPTEITAVKGRALRRLPRMEYYYLRIGSSLRLDAEASGIGDWPYCDECGRFISATRRRLTRYVLAEDAEWDGSDVSKVGSYMLWRVLCVTRRIVDRARECEWTNLRIEPLDIPLSASCRWSGIDYLGDRWPPVRWYPEVAGNDVPTWIDRLQSEDRREQTEAIQALQELGKPAIEALGGLVTAGDAEARARASRVLVLMHVQGATVDAAVLKLVREVAHGDRRLMEFLGPE